MKSKISRAIFLLLSIFSYASVNSQPANGDIVKIKNVNASRYATPVGAAADENTAIELIGNSTGSQFNWRVSRVPTGGGSTSRIVYYRFQNMHSNKYLGVLDGSRSNYGIICQKDFITRRGAPPQNDLLWALESTSTGFKMRNLNSNLYLAVEGGGAGDNARLIQWSDAGQADLNWQFQLAGTDASTESGRKILIDVVLNYIAVSEATRNKIDNGDCRRVFGHIKTELWELDEHNEMKTRLSSYNNMSELLYNEPNYSGPPTAAVDYHGWNLGNSTNANIITTDMGKVTYNIPERLLINRKAMLVVKVYLGTRHKDNDFASYDAIRMQEEITRSFTVNSSGGTTQLIQTTAAANSHIRSSMVVAGTRIPAATFGGDDTHNVWVRILTNRH